MKVIKWKPIKDFEGIYEVSNDGRVRSLDKKVNVSNQYGAKAKRIIKGRELKQIFNGMYYVVGLSNNNKMKQYFVHRLVAETFIDNPNNYNCVNHIDCNKLNNNVNNLEWCSKEYNTSVAWKDGQINIPKGKNNKMYGKYGKDANKSKPIYQYDLQGNFIKKWDSQKDVERELGFRQNCISNCALGRSKSSYGYVWRLNYE